MTDRPEQDAAPAPSSATTPCRPHNVTLTDEMWEHATRTYGPRGIAGALEDAYRAQHGLPPRPRVQTRGRFVAGENSRTRGKKPKT